MLQTQEITEPQGGIVKYFEGFRWTNVIKQSYIGELLGVVVNPLN